MLEINTNEVCEVFKLENIEFQKKNIYYKISDQIFKHP